MNKKNDQVDGKKRMISLFITGEEFERWNNSFKSLGYSTRTNMIKDAVNSLFLPKKIKEEKMKIDTSSLEKEIKELRKENAQTKQELLTLNREMLKFLANGYQNTKITKQITTTQSIIQLIKEKPRTLGEISNILGCDETNALELLNELVKKDLIYFHQDNMEWRSL